MTQNTDSNTPEIHLTPWHGIHPGIVVLCKWILLLLATAILPSLCHQGERVSFQSNRPGMLVSVDGIPLASAPIDAYLAPGEHKATLSWAGVSAGEEVFRVKRHLFFSWISEGTRAIKLNATSLPTGLVRQIEADFLTELSQRNPVFQDDDTYPTKPLFSLYMGILGDQADKELFKKAAHWASSPALCADATEATGKETHPFPVGEKLSFDTTHGKGWPYPAQPSGERLGPSSQNPKRVDELTGCTPQEMFAWTKENKCRLLTVAEVQSYLDGGRVPTPLPLPYAWVTSDIFDLRWICTGEVGDPSIFLDRGVALPSAVCDGSGRITCLSHTAHSDAVGALVVGN